LRVDLPLPDITEADMAAYGTRVRKKRLCNDYILAGACSKENCQFDHNQVKQNVGNVLRSVVRDNVKCPKGGQCRSRSCYKGHVKVIRIGGLNNIEYKWVMAEED
jgi:hypothetical protein